MRFDSDMTDASGTSSQDTERRQIREQAARINQEMRASTRYVSPFIQGLRNKTSSGFDRQTPTGSVMNSPRLGGSSSSFLGAMGSSRPSSLSTRFRNIPSSLSMAPVHNRFAADPTTSEQTNIINVLAETNVTYDRGQHAVYEDPVPGREHKGFQHFNNLQYSYQQQSEQHRRRKMGQRQQQRRQAKRRSRQDDDLDFELDLDLEDLDMDFEEGGLERVDKDALPQSPQWHLKSLELAKIEAENRSRAITSNDSSGGIGGISPTTQVPYASSTTMMGLTAPRLGVDDMRSSLNVSIGGGSGFNSAATTGTANTNATIPSVATSAVGSAQAPTQPQPPRPTSTTTENLAIPPFGGRGFSRFSPGVPAVSFSEAQDEAFPWHASNPVIIYSPPPPEPGDEDYTGHNYDGHDHHMETGEVGPGEGVGGGVDGTSPKTSPPLERFQSLSPAIMHLPPSAIDSFNNSSDIELSTLTTNSSGTGPAGARTLIVQPPQVTSPPPAHRTGYEPL
ncbi:hypothetical protein BGX23_011244 [Mortierella sp. AD031]|nr:hypothetical protein BGX23_011244 [Mortierella sp. AD031]